jgi:hypothetical protein
MDFRRSVEMSLSREEFFRLLPAAVGPFVVDGDTVEPGDGTCRWRVRLTPLAIERAGAVAIPRHQVDIAMEGCSEAEAAAFMERFLRGFLRGGG